MEEQRKLYEKYPSLRKLEELGDQYVEVRIISCIQLDDLLFSGTMAAKLFFCAGFTITHHFPKCATTLV